MAHKALKIGFLGFGSRGISFVNPCLNHDIRNRIITIIDPDISRSKFFLKDCVGRGEIPAEEAESVRFIASLDDLKEGEVDCLFLTASERVRAMVFEQAVETGAHIYMEKGLSVDIEGARAIVKGMEKCRPGQKIFMGFNLRHAPAMIKAKSILAEGRIGQILYLRYFEMLRYRHGSSYFARFHRDVKQSGGMMITKACHDFDLIGHFLDSRPGRVFSVQQKRMFGLGGPEARQDCHTCDRTNECEFERMRRYESQKAKRHYAEIYLNDDKATTDGYIPDKCCWRDDTELCDLSHVVFDFDNGVPATYTQVIFAPANNRIIEVFGDQGRLVVDEWGSSITVTDRWNTHSDNIKFNPAPGGHGGADDVVIDTFFRTIHDDLTPTCTIEDGVWSLATALAAYKSADTEQWVDVKPFADAALTPSDTPNA